MKKLLYRTIFCLFTLNCFCCDDLTIAKPNTSKNKKYSEVMLDQEIENKGKCPTCGCKCKKKKRHIKKNHMIKHDKTLLKK